jgi:hypothetical protein
MSKFKVGDIILRSNKEGEEATEEWKIIRVDPSDDSVPYHCSSMTNNVENWISEVNAIEVPKVLPKLKPVTISKLKPLDIVMVEKESFLLLFRNETLNDVWECVRLRSGAQQGSRISLGIALKKAFLVDNLGDIADVLTTLDYDTSDGE